MKPKTTDLVNNDRQPATTGWLPIIGARAEVSFVDNTRLLSLVVFVLFAGSCIAALFFKKNLLWMDELLSYLLIQDASFTHMNKALVSGFEQTPPIFFNLYWLIGHIISLNVIVLKSVSVVLFATTLALFYRYTTRLIGTPVLNFLLITSIAAFTYLNITLAMQIRSYVILLLVCFIYFTVIHRLIQQPTRPRLLILHIGVGLLLALTHNFGLFYLAASGAFFGVLWLWSGDRRYWYVLGSFGIIGVVWLLAWYPFFAVQAKTGEPHSWIPLPTWPMFFRIAGELAPTLSNKLEEVTGALPVLAIVRFTALIALFGYLAVPRLKRGATAALADPAFMFYLMSAFIYAATLLITLVVTFTHTSLFISRYLWPSHLLIIYQLMYAFYHLAGRGRVARWQNSAARTNGWHWLLPPYVAVLGGLLFYQSRKLTLLPVTATLMGYVDRLDKRYPVFLESAVNFMPIWYYNPDRPVRFLLDYESAFAPGNDSGTTVGYYTLSAVKNQFHVNAIIPLTEFNSSRISHFYVVDEPWNYQIERFIRNKSVTVIRTMPTTVGGIKILECVFTTAGPTTDKAPGNK